MTSLPPPPELWVLQQAVEGRFAVEHELGRGGMGIVFRARDLSLDRPVAIKLLAPELAQDPESRERFLNEARIAGGLSHPNIVPIHAVESHDKAVFIVMGFIDGDTLGERVRRVGPLHRRDTFHVLRDVTWALGHAHLSGVIHRDIKPDNVLLDRFTGRALVTDFGIARVTGRPSEAAATALGTPHYASPEQVEGRTVDARSDLYSLGATAFFGLTGRPPFEGDSPRVLLSKLLTEPAPKVADFRSDLPATFASAIDRCLEKDPADRLPSAEALAAVLVASQGEEDRIPLPVKAYVREAKVAVGEIGSSLTAAGMSIVMLATVFGFGSFEGIVFYPIAALFAGLAAIRFGGLFLHTRSLVDRGYGASTIRPALVVEEREEDEERSLRPGRGFMDRPAGVILLGLIKTAPAVWLATLDTAWLSILGAVGAVLMPMGFIRQLWQVSPPARRVWSRWLGGRIGKFLFKLAGIGVKKDRLLAAADAPTGVLLGGAVEDLYRALPMERRKEFADVPELARQLEADAVAVTNSGARSVRRTHAVAALEAIRLDLLRLHHGEGSADRLTQDLEAARRLGERVDETLARGDEP
jgi:serine/threonine-protein kinase